MLLPVRNDKEEKTARKYFKRSKRAGRSSEEMAPVCGRLGTALHAIVLRVRNPSLCKMNLALVVPVTDKFDGVVENVEQGRHINSYDIAEELGTD
ncbi:hypothetical protein EVAR_65164_1 [Eumeta japonica]|uniref:Uncharacterized protein n=1 Tax=Eumeta variegata TaxID=151549 RepID=A0A4C1ZPR4_EUMVA|nr:hypothetical protein EVAR_65164_1 [Eumeta japonica]